MNTNVHDTRVFNETRFRNGPQIWVIHPFKYSFVFADARFDHLIRAKRRINRPKT